MGNDKLTYCKHGEHIGMDCTRCMREALAASEQRNPELQERLQKLVVAWRNTEGVLTEQGAHQMAGGYYNCAEDLSDAISPTPAQPAAGEER